MIILLNYNNIIHVNTYNFNEIQQKCNVELENFFYYKNQMISTLPCDDNNDNQNYLYVFQKNYFQQKQEPFFIPPVLSYKPILYLSKNNSSIDDKKNIKSSKCCVIKNCFTFASFGEPGKKKIHCGKHRLENEQQYSSTTKRICNTCKKKFTYSVWYFHEKICGKDDNINYCKKCNTEVANIFKHNYICKKNYF